ncbi:MAG: sigma-54-dependent Fis family transcriptional regulator [Deltaproteobacteria bacterium]|nr:sigma-54-dependent Fis family transcriptional regulator [Deltaproteobacteria bacterium]
MTPTQAVEENLESSEEEGSPVLVGNQKEEMRILLIEDEELLLNTYQEWLEPEGYKIYTAQNGVEGIKKAKMIQPNLVLLDLRLPPSKTTQEGLTTLGKVREVNPNCKVIIMTADETQSTAISAIRQGADDYLIKPVDPEVLRIVVERTLERLSLESRIQRLKHELEDRYSFYNIIGKSQQMLEIFKQVERCANTSANILLRGESGTGKELVARAIHQLSERREKKFVAVNCAALAEGIKESELFGHEKGAFTDAKSRRIGYFEMADGGTLFLDEIGDIPISTQVKLLRVIQEQEFQRVGGSETIKVNARVISATNRDLEKLIDKEQFREDLYYRLNGFSVTLPPLRIRREDIPLLGDYFLEIYSQKENKPIAGFSDEAMELMVNYSWPGNVRELENEIHRLVLQADRGAVIGSQLLPDRIKVIENIIKMAGIQKATLKETMRRVEQWLITECLKKNRANRTATAKELGISREGLHMKISKLGIRSEHGI